MTLHSNDGSRALVVPAVPLRKHQRRFFPTLRSYVSVARGDSRRRHETELCRQGSGRASAELVRMRGKRLVYRDPMRQPHSGAREMPLKRRLGCGPGHRVHTLRGGTSPGHAHSDAPGCRVSSAGTRPEATEQALSTFQQTRGPPPDADGATMAAVLCDVRCQADTRSATAGDGDGISWELETT